MLPERIITERLILRQFRESDRDDVFEFLSQLEDDEFEGYPGITYDNCLTLLRQRIDSGEFYAMELSDTGKVIGNIFCGSRDQNSLEVGYIVNEYHRRNGYAYEALDAIIDAAFFCGIHRIYAQCDPLNERSWRLLEKLGMTREAHLRKNMCFVRDENGDPVWKDTYIYAVLEEDRQ